MFPRVIPSRPRREPCDRTSRSGAGAAGGALARLGRLVCGAQLERRGVGRTRGRLRVEPAAGAHEVGAGLHKLELYWENGDCAPIAVDFNSAEQVTGWDEGQLCVEGASDLVPGTAYSCRKPDRKRYCTIPNVAAGADTRELVRQVQNVLTLRDYDVGTIDGIYGPKTAAAIRAYQRQNGLQQDGKATSQLLTRLRKGKAKRIQKVDTGTAIYLCQKVVRAAAKFPSKADFPFLAVGLSENEGGYTVHGEVELMNGIGLMVPHKYICSVENRRAKLIALSPG